MKRTALVLTACAVAAAWSLPAAAQVLDLAQAYRLASENDANIRASRAATEARAERLPQARSQLLPNVSASASAFRNNLVSTVPGFGGVPIVSHLHYNSSSRALTLRQPIYRPFQMADYRQAKAQVEQANAELERDEQSLAVRLTTAYLQLLGAQDQLELVLAQKAAYQTQLESARKRFAGGAGTRTDIDEAQARYDLSVAQELEARQNLGYTRQQLQSMVVEPVSDIARIDEARLPLAPPTPDSAERPSWRSTRREPATCPRWMRSRSGPSATATRSPASTRATTRKPSACS